jgi:formylglycine-generating enzyme required for sulfatase activity
VVTPAWATLVEALPDPAVVTDPMLRGRITATGWAWRVRDTATQVEMLLVPPGTFQMGCVMGSALVGCTPFEGPVHPVTLTDAFYLGRYEVTQAQWLGRMGTNPSRYQASNGHPGSMERPVEAVSWEMAQAFVASAGLRLPTEAEWEYACRAGTETPFHAGPGFPLGTSDDALLTLIAHFRSAPCQVCLVTTTQVGGKAANSLGLHDLLGNVWEWTNDRSSNYYEPGPQTNPTGPLFGNARVFRGGSFSQPSGSTRSSFRRGLDAGSWYDDLGFRVARNP